MTHADRFARKAKLRSNTSGPRLAVDAGVLAVLGGAGAYFMAETPYKFGVFPSGLVLVGFPALVLFGTLTYWWHFNTPAKRKGVLASIAKIRQKRMARYIYLLAAGIAMLNNPPMLSSANAALAVSFFGIISAFYLLCTERGWERVPGLLPRR